MQCFKIITWGQFQTWHKLTFRFPANSRSKKMSRVPYNEKLGLLRFFTTIYNVLKHVNMTTVQNP